jgi:hypothetical protein
MRSIVIVELNGGLVNEVYDELGEPVEYRVVDHDAWEGGECPFCRSERIENVGGEIEDTSRYTIITGGYTVCLDCLETEDTDIVEWIRSGGLEV